MSFCGFLLAVGSAGVRGQETGAQRENPDWRSVSMKEEQVG
jgi:hypothetical protein